MRGPKFELDRDMVSAGEAANKEYDIKFYLQESLGAMEREDYDNAVEHAEIAFQNAKDFYEIARRLKSGR